MGYFVGIDAGGTKTECWLGDETRVLGRVSGGSVKLARVGREVATERLQGILREVGEAAGVGLGEVARTCVGIAGYSMEGVREWVETVVGEAVGGEVQVCGDEEIGLEAAFKGGAGILVVGGTGMAVVGRCGDGKMFRAGGWGPGIGDEGSGYWIGREALRAAFWAYDRGERSAVIEGVRVAWGVEDLAGVVSFANARPGPDFAALAPVVVRAAEEGDRVAGEVLRLAGEALAAQVGAVWGRMREAGETGAGVAYAGSVLERIAAVREAMRAGLGEGLRMQGRAVDSMEGAMWMARGKSKGSSAGGA